MKILPHEARCLVATQLRSDRSVREVAQIAKVPAHVAQYALRKLQDSGVMRRGVLIDASAIGWEQWIAYLSFTERKEKAKGRLLQRLREEPTVGWYAELGGQFHIACAFFVKHSHEVPEFLELIARAHGGQIRRKVVARVLSFTVLAKQYLVSSSVPRERELVTIAEGARGSIRDLDPLDLKILGALSGKGSESRPALARVVGMPRSTVEYRIKRLQEDGILARELFFVSSQRIGAQLFRLLLTMKGLTSRVTERVRELARQEAEVVSLTWAIGGWDYELGIEVYEAPRASAVLDRICEKLGDEVVDAVLLPVFVQGTSDRFLH